MEQIISTFVPYEVVRVMRVPASARSNAWEINMRNPEVGDYGTVVEILGAEGVDTVYVVECVDSSGHTVWLSEFMAHEIERAAINA